MIIETVFPFSGAFQRWVCRFSGLRLNNRGRIRISSEATIPSIGTKIGRNTLTKNSCQRLPNKL